MALQLRTFVLVLVGNLLFISAYGASESFNEFSDNAQSARRGENVPTVSLDERMDKLERLVYQQGEVIVQQQDEITSLKRQIDDRDADMTELRRHYLEQNEEISTLKRQLRSYDVIVSGLLQQSKSLAVAKHEGLDDESSHVTDNDVKSDDGGPEEHDDVKSDNDSKLNENSDRDENTTKANNKPPNDVKRDVTKRSDEPTLADLEVVLQQMSHQVTQLNSDVQVLKTSTAQWNTQIQDARSSTYVRWGHSTCPGSSQLVYSGVMGGGQLSETGTGVNNLCLTLSPVFGGNNGFYSFLYGTEFETHDSYQDKDPLCAVCHAPYTTTVMIPGTNACTSGWTLQYAGYLMGGHNTDPAASEFICVDSAMETRIGSDANINGKLLFYTATRCGALPCGPYIDNRVVLCAVCSK